MKKHISILSCILVLLICTVAVADAKVYLGGMISRESETYSLGRTWYGVCIRSLGSGLIGSDLDLRLHFTDVGGESVFLAQLNPFIHLNLPLGNLNLYGGTSPMTVFYMSAGDGDLDIDFHLFYLKAGAQFDIGPVGLFAHGIGKLDLDDVGGSFQRMSYEFGAAIGF